MSKPALLAVCGAQKRVAAEKRKLNYANMEPTLRNSVCFEKQNQAKVLLQTLSITSNTSTAIAKYGHQFDWLCRLFSAHFESQFKILKKYVFHLNCLPGGVEFEKFLKLRWWGI